ncbi:MAG: hypothetical protein KCCBMMGE_00291 [Candidatus Methanoperedenaceae archaeon GB37]|nr:MAG: hypothetical protein KCCBMMGE_00291 [Candidatus Methanoperedenaceae archaeon GB37]
MKVKEFYQTYLDIKNPFSHQLQFFHLALSNKFPILVKAPTGSGKDRNGNCAIFETVC